MDMWDKFRKRDGNCVEYRAALEELRPEIGEAEGRAELSRILPVELAAHAEGCEACGAAAEEFWESRRLLAGAFSGEGAGEEMHTLRGEGAPWLATRVMAKIAEREVEERRAKLEWSGAVSRLASRMALVGAAMLVLTSTWLYEPPSDGGRGNAAAGQSATEAAPQYLFDSGAGNANVDDALAGGAERQR
jgi:hypothetical protein